MTMTNLNLICKKRPRRSTKNTLPSSLSSSSIHQYTLCCFLLQALLLCQCSLSTHAKTSSAIDQLPSGPAMSSTTEQTQTEEEAITNTKRRRRRDAVASPRIVGGTVVNDATKYPFYLEWDDAKCGASLIHDDIALSAAHCENDVHPFAMRVYMLGTKTETGLFRTIERQVAHPLYDGDKQDYDFMLLKLHSSALVDPLTGNPTGAATIDINRNPNVPAVGDPLTAIGFGKTSEEAPETSADLREVEIYYVSDDICLEQYGVSDYVQELMFCAGVPGGGRDTCQGDSGGPIIDQTTNTQVGAVSFGVGCAQADYSGVNARVSSVSNWIDAQICLLSDHPPARCAAAGNGNGNGNANGSANGNGNGGNTNNNLPSGPGQMSITVTYDDYPEETAWSLTYLGPTPNPAAIVASASAVGATNVNPRGTPGAYEDQIQIFAVPFGREDVVGDRETLVETFTNLPLGRYSAQFGDAAGDGICCGYGNGKLEVKNDKTGTVVWNNNGIFGTYVEVILDIGPGGTITEVEENDVYDNSWEAFTAVNHPPTFDQEWPGAMPTADRNAVMINVKFDTYPEETGWQFYSEVGGSWNRLRSFAGGTEGTPADLVSVEMDNLSAGWYRFTISDRGADGICCLHRRGWVSLTAPIVTTRQAGLVWGNNGEFGTSLDVYLQMDSEGFVSQVSYSDPLTAVASRATSLRRRQDSGKQQQQQVEGNDEDNDNGGTRQRQLAMSSFTDLPKHQLHKSLPLSSR